MDKPYTNRYIVTEELPIPPTVIIKQVEVIVERFLPAPLPPKPVRNKLPKQWTQQYKSYYTRAKQKNIPFDFTLDEFNTFIAAPCHYCGKLNANGIDKIDCKLGYTKINCVACCFMCNSMKFTYTTEQFLQHIKQIALHNNLLGIN